jgi:RimJ/RimL family protein N-acetyltransferase
LIIEPLYGLRLGTPRLELRLGSHDELVELERLAEKGIHPPEEMPFGIAWTDRIGEAGFLEEFVEFHEAALREWTPERWTLNLLVFFGSQLIGSQTVHGETFAATRTVGTGPWLGRDFQRQGLGTEMRAAVLELAFNGLGAEAATSGAIVGNEASKRVSEKLGYRVTGMSTMSPRGEPLDHYDFRIERGDWSAPVPVEIAGLDPCLALFGVT